MIQLPETQKELEPLLIKGISKGLIKHIHITHLQGVTCLDKKLAMVCNSQVDHSKIESGRLH